eukprot:TRINITY_DN994_c1_g1_i2.p1 TRINITY_DN994_c1_g1~~TRINITY_DN994_c1_g1_i2.p1  ORF type:complete len:69 (+),score=20.27 TRINITY_DN994_c1_g1_i2:250-456(+)
MSCSYVPAICGGGGGVVGGSASCLSSIVSEIGWKGRCEVVGGEEELVSIEDAISSVDTSFLLFEKAKS